MNSTCGWILKLKPAKFIFWFRIRYLIVFIFIIFDGALCYLTDRQIDKDRDIQNSELQITEYLLPNKFKINAEYLK